MAIRDTILTILLDRFSLRNLSVGMKYDFNQIKNPERFNNLRGLVDKAKFSKILPLILNRFLVADVDFAALCLAYFF